MKRDCCVYWLRRAVAGVVAGPAAANPRKDSEAPDAIDAGACCANLNAFWLRALATPSSPSFLSLNPPQALATSARVATSVLMLCMDRGFHRGEIRHGVSPKAAARNRRSSCDHRNAVCK